MVRLPLRLLTLGLVGGGIGGAYDKPDDRKILFLLLIAKRAAGVAEGAARVTARPHA